MASDLVERLREHATLVAEGSFYDATERLLNDAADEIERIRAQQVAPAPVAWEVWNEVNADYRPLTRKPLTDADRAKGHRRGAHSDTPWPVAPPRLATMADFPSDGNEEARWIDSMQNACPHCGGSGHKDDVAVAPPVDQAADGWPRGTRIRIEHDGFEGVVLDPYTTLEGKRGHVCQLAGAMIVHVYGDKWLTRVDAAQAALPEGDRGC